MGIFDLLDDDGNEPVFSMDEFLELKDENLKKYLYCERKVQKSKWELYKIDNKFKTGWYHKYCTLKINNSGKVYKQSSLKEWIVYNKGKKEVVLSNSTTALKEVFIKEYFGYSFIKPYVPKLTKTLVKKIVEGKIITYDDLMKYHRSYTIRNTQISLQCVSRFMAAGLEWTMASLRDPEEFITSDDFRVLSQCPNFYITSRFKKLDKSELKNIKQVYYEWRDKEAKEYDEILRPRVSQNGN